MTDDTEGADVSRRALLRASGGAVGLSVVGTAAADDGGDGRAASGPEPAFERCPDATLRPSTGYCAGASTVGCADDHQATVELRAAVRETLETRYPDVGALLDAGFKPYFDTLEVTDDDGWSHWLNPAFIGDDTVLNPDRPESVLVDNETWRSIGVMFIATRDGDPIEAPPAVYENDEATPGDPNDDGVERDGADDQTEADPDHDDGEGHDGHDHGAVGHEDRCSPWHYHAGLPGRFAWWFYRQTYEADVAGGELSAPCRTPCVMHVWTVDHPESVYAHDAPPAEYRDLEPATEPGFDTDAEPGADELDWDVLPEEVVPDSRPEEFSLLEFRR